jgi:hypothetical protein
MSPPPVIEITGLAAALAALDAAEPDDLPLSFTTADGAANWLGVPVFAEIARQARETTAKPARFNLHCAGNAAAAAEALSSPHIDSVTFTGHPDTLARLQRLANELGKEVQSNPQR